MDGHAIIWFAQWMCLVYFFMITATYLLLNVLSLRYLIRYRSDRSLGSFPLRYSGLEPPISVLVPAYNEEATITASVRSLLQLTYAEYEVIVINDGSKDQTLDELIREFSLVRSLLPVRNLIPTMPLRGVYRSSVNRHLRVIDKENGGKADALNAGINVSCYPLYCGIQGVGFSTVLLSDS